VRLVPGAIEMIDQTRLPAEAATLRCGSWEEVVEAIRRLAIRGAPAIGVAGAMGVALAAESAAPAGEAAQAEELARAVAGLRHARPTAVNLARAVDAQARLASAHPGPPAARAGALAEAARALHAAEVERCRRMGRHALPLVDRGARVMTVCNTGALATGGYGTALGVVRAAHEEGRGVRAIVCETRPLLQGARLTTWELARLGIPFTLIADAMAASLMAAGTVSLVVVGADRIAANGDVANKIGTYALAVLAREHGIPFAVAAPTTTVDLATPSAAAIPVEERGAEEVRGLALMGLPAAPPDAPVVNPAFDLTPARLVSAIVTEQGVHRPPYDRSLRAAVEAEESRHPRHGSVTHS
jgi:methylthioribose-1-phosphate isomerase